MSSATAHVISGGDGNDWIANYGYAGYILGDNGNDTIFNPFGALAYQIQGGNGWDLIFHGGRVIANIEGNNDRDTVTIYNGAKVGGIVDGGDPTTYPGDTLILEVIFRSITGNAMLGDLIDSDGDLLRWQHFEELLTLDPPVNGNHLPFDYLQSDGYSGFVGTVGPIPALGTILSFLQIQGLLPLEAGADSPELNETLDDITALLLEALFSPDAAAEEAAWAALLGLVEDLALGAGPQEIWLDLGDFLEALKHGFNEGFILVFNADEIALWQWLESLMDPVSGNYEQQTEH